MDATSGPSEPRIVAAVGRATVTTSRIVAAVGTATASDTAGVAYQVARVLRALDPLGATGVKVTVGLELQAPSARPADAEAPSLPPPSASEPAAASTGVEWAPAATRRLRDKGRIPKDIKQADLARLLAAESQRAVKDGQLRRELKNTYIENKLKDWGIWPLDSFK
jgi:hypothetical protein